MKIMREEFNVAENVVVVFDKVHDDFGFLRDICEVVKTDENGHKTIYPTYPPVKVTTYSKNDPIIPHSTVRFSMDDAIRIYDGMKYLWSPATINNKDKVK